MAPKGTPSHIIKKLNVQINRILNDPEVRKTLSAEGAIPVGGTAQQAAASVTQGIKKWRALAEQIN